MVSATTMAISAAVSTARIRPATSTRARPRAVTTAQMTSAHAHQGQCTPRWAAASACAAGPSAPYVATWNDSYATRAISAAATPVILPSPAEAKA